MRPFCGGMYDKRVYGKNFIVITVVYYNIFDLGNKHIRIKKL